MHALELSTVENQYPLELYSYPTTQLRKAFSFYKKHLNVK